MSTTNSTAALLAIVSLMATPAAAAELPQPGQPRSVDAAVPHAADADMEADRHRRWRYRRHRGVSVGDVIRGAIIIGGIAVVADAARDAERDAERERRERRRERERDYDYERDYDDRDYRDRRDADRYARSVGPAVAAEACQDEVERLGVAGDADLIRRSGDGWRVEGRMDDGTPYSCEIGPDGRIREIGTNRVALDAPYTARDEDYIAPVSDAQADIDYAAARERMGSFSYYAPEPDATSEVPYLGGPVDGDLEEGEG